MTVDFTTLPEPVRAYLAASDMQDHGAVAQTFAPDGTATDEGQTHAGRAAIRAWREDVAGGYTYTTETTGVRHEGDVWIVAVHLEGDFPGNVVDLEQRFTVREEGIVTLVIA